MAENTEYQCSEDRFLSDTKDHALEVVRNDGVHRHLKFRRPGTNCYGFDLITWPGYLCISGDMGCFVFSWLNDMFEFFRTVPETIWPKGNKELSINPSYWHEKVQAENRNSGCEAYSRKKFEAAVKDYFDSFFQSYDYDWKDECWLELEDEVLSAENEYEAHERASGFSFKDFQFSDFWECDLKEYTFHYLWCLYAIVWGIKQFDKRNGGVA